MRTLDRLSVAVLMMVCVMLGACGKQDPPKKRAAGPPDAGPKPDASPATRTVARVNADNDSPRPLTLIVDGKDKHELAPYAIIALDLDPGKHTFKFMDGDKVVEQMAPTLEAGQLTILNPGGTASYLQITYKYVRPGAGGGPPPRVNRQPSGAILQWDGAHGLLEDVPEMVFAEGDRLPDDKVKIWKSAPSSIPHAQAILMLRDQRSAWQQDDLLRAVNVLGEGPGGEAVIEALTSCIAKGRARLVGAVFKSAATHVAAIPEAQLIQWATTPQGTGAYAPAGHARIRGAARVLIATGRGKKLIEKIGDAPPENISTIVGAFKAAPHALQRELVMSRLGKGNKELDAALCGLACDEEFKLDKEVAEKVEKLIVDSTDNKFRLRMGARWEDKLCASTGDLETDFLLPRLTKIINGPYKPRKERALQALIRVEGGKHLVSIFPQLNETERKNLINDFASVARREGKASPVGLALARKALEDPDMWLRQAAFRYICENALADPDHAGALMRTLEAETDEPMKRRMRKYVKEAVEALVPRDTAEQQLRQFVIAGPCPPVTEAALLRLRRAAGTRTIAQHQKDLSALYAQCKTPENRAWLVAAVEDAYSDRAFKKMREALYRKALGDRDEAVRAAAVVGMLDFVREFGEDSRKLEAVAGRITDLALKARTRRKLDLWAIDRYAQMLRKEDTRAKAEMRLTQLTRSDDLEVASEAVLAIWRGRRYRRANQTDMVPLWTKLYERILADPVARADDGRKNTILQAVEFANDRDLVAFYKVALSDPDGRQRQRLFSELARRYQKQKSEAILGLLKAAVAAEKDNRTRQQMERTLERL